MDLPAVFHPVMSVRVRQHIVEVKYEDVAGDQAGEAAVSRLLASCTALSLPDIRS